MSLLGPSALGRPPLPTLSCDRHINASSYELRGLPSIQGATAIDTISSVSTTGAESNRASANKESSARYFGQRQCCTAYFRRRNRKGCRHFDAIFKQFDLVNYDTKEVQTRISFRGVLTLIAIWHLLLSRLMYKKKGNSGELGCRAMKGYEGQKIY